MTTFILTPNIASSLESFSVSSLTFSSKTSSSITYTITDMSVPPGALLRVMNSDNSARQTVVDNTSGVAPLSTGTSITVSGLSPNTAYQFYLSITRGPYAKSGTTSSSVTTSFGTPTLTAPTTTVGRTYQSAFTTQVGISGSGYGTLTFRIGSTNSSTPAAISGISINSSGLITATSGTNWNNTVFVVALNQDGVPTIISFLLQVFNENSVSLAAVSDITNIDVSSTDYTFTVSQSAAGLNLVRYTVTDSPNTFNIPTYAPGVFPSSTIPNSGTTSVTITIARNTVLSNKTVYLVAQNMSNIATNSGVASPFSISTLNNVSAPVITSYSISSVSGSTVNISLSGFNIGSFLVSVDSLFIGVNVTSTTVNNFSAVNGSRTATNYIISIPSIPEDYSLRYIITACVNTNLGGSFVTRTIAYCRYNSSTPKTFTNILTVQQPNLVVFALATDDGTGRTHAINGGGTISTVFPSMLPYTNYTHARVNDGPIMLLTSIASNGFNINGYIVDSNGNKVFAPSPYTIFQTSISKFELGTYK